MNIDQTLQTLLLYLVGSVPTGYWFCKLFFGIDITQKGSGNIGATNVARVLEDWRWFVVVFLLDTAKAWGILFFLGLQHNPLPILTSAFILLFGNAYSIFLRFQGGKGVATTLGICAYAAPNWFIGFLITCSFLMVLLRRVDLSVLLTMAGIVVFSPFLAHKYDLMMLFLFLFGWMLFRHRENVYHLARDTW